MTVASITVKELRARMERGDCMVVIDVRSAEEFAEGHVDGAVHVPVADVARAALAFDAGARLVTVCSKGGGRSQAAAIALAELGRNVAYLEGGTLAWLDETMPA